MRRRYYYHRKKRKRPFYWGLVLFLFVLLPGGSVYYLSGSPHSCARCHEIQPAYTSWLASTHHDIDCKDCHGSLLTFNLRFHKQNLKRLISHVKGSIPERIHIPHGDLEPLTERCRSCHRLEFAEWETGPHGVMYAAVFLDETHNRSQLPTDDCLRCHGMFYEGGIRDLVVPIDTKGPWILSEPELAGHRAIPCMACHQIHRERDALVEPDSPKKEKHEYHRSTLAFYDRRGRMHTDVRSLPMPEMKDGKRRIGVNPDVRQTLCYQCHAPLAGFQAGSGDDRTCTGVHEGIGCLACHQAHSQQTGPSCSDCHPRLSNCNLDVTEMETTFKSPSSPHDIHTVSCADCHPTGLSDR